MQLFIGFNYCKPLENYEDRKLQISKTIWLYLYSVDKKFKLFPPNVNSAIISL